MIKTPNKPATRGSYPMGEPWTSYSFDGGKALVIESPADGRFSCARQAPPGLVPSTRKVDTIEDLFVELRLWDRAQYPELIEWFDSHFKDNPDALQALAKRYYGRQNESWDSLVSDPPISSLELLREALSKDHSIKWDNVVVCGRLLVDSYDNAGDLDREESLYIMDLPGAGLMMVFVDHMKYAGPPIAVQIDSVRTFKELASAEEGQEVSMLKELGTYREILRRIP